jgi:hypothetical protein
VSAYPVTIHCRSAGGEVQFPLDGRQRDVDDAGVELQHELGGDHEPERQARPWGRRAAPVRRADTRLSEGTNRTGRKTG